jgi:hypothetical protein
LSQTLPGVTPENTSRNAALKKNIELKLKKFFTAPGSLDREAG